MHDLIIRPAQPNDAALILALIQELAAYEKMTVRLSEEAVRRDMMGTACRCDLAFVGSQAAGIATWYWTYKSFSARRGLFIEDLYVREAWRGRGLGKALLAHLAEKAKALGGFLEWQVLDWNASAIAFYEKLGARPIAQWRNFRLDGDALERLAK